MTVIKPCSTIDILGGGQLGRMISIAGRNMGYRFITLDPTPNSPCGQVADLQITAPFSELKAVKELADSSDVITYEFENVDSTITSILEILCTSRKRTAQNNSKSYPGKIHVKVLPYTSSSFLGHTIGK